MSALSDDERMLFAVLAAAEEPMDMFDVGQAVRQAPLSNDDRLRTDRCFRDLWLAKFVWPTSAFDWTPLLWEITAAGRDALDGARKDTGTCT